MLFLNLRQILPPQISFVVRQKVHIFGQKFCHKSRISPISSNFVKNQYFRHDGQFSSFRQYFVKKEILWSLQIGKPTTLQSHVFNQAVYCCTCKFMTRESTCCRVLLVGQLKLCKHTHPRIVTRIIHNLKSFRRHKKSS